MELYVVGPLGRAALKLRTCSTEDPTKLVSFHVLFT
jgi:hypothetical protein